MLNSKINSSSKQKSRFYYAVSMALSITFVVAGPVIGCIFVGLVLDKMLQTSPYLLLIGGLVGFIGSIVNSYKLLDRMK
jgi:F0F1-type ATP synthase assembly protein I